MSSEIPPIGTPEREWWIAGARAERQARVESLGKKEREFVSFVDTMADCDYDVDEMARMTAIVYTCEWSWRRRLRLAWGILRPGQRCHLRVYRDAADWWVGYYRGDTHHYVCLFPTIVIRWDRRGGRS